MTIELGARRFSQVIGQGSSGHIANYPTEILMSVARTIGLTIALACSGYLHAQSCSGGIDGGMDATGNQCSSAEVLAAYATQASVPASKPLRATKRPDSVVGQNRRAKVTMTKVSATTP
jgi:ferredoxin